jgi:hypothetical protein
MIGHFKSLKTSSEKQEKYFAKRKKLPKKEKPFIPEIKTEEVKTPEPPKDIYKEQFAQLAQQIADMQTTLQQLVESDKKVHTEIEKPEKIREDIIYKWVDQINSSSKEKAEVEKRIKDAIDNHELNIKEGDIILSQIEWY